nr:immunoglobulin light chain junction region [Macaca mulatta]
CQQYNGAPRTF